MCAVQCCSIVVDSDTRDEVPVPGSGDIFVLIAVQVCVNNPIGEMETKKLQGINTMNLMEGKDLTFSEFVHSVFRVLDEYILREVT